MIIHEYQGKELMNQVGIPTTQGRVASTPAEAKAIAAEIGKKVAVKAQVHIGGRGKAGGIKLAETPQEAEEAAAKIIGMDIKGLRVNKVLVEECIEIDREFYLGITLDRDAGTHVVMLSPMGGVDIEEVAKTHPDQIFKLHTHPWLGVQDYEIREMLYQFEVEPAIRKQLHFFVKKAYELYRKWDCVLTEINPLAILKDGRVVAADSKMNFDDNATYRHPELEAMREVAEEDPMERQAKERGLNNYVRLDGDVGIIGNGAGLVMGTLDIVAREGGKPANFLDVGGGANAALVANALGLVLSDPNVKGVLFNIFGGITRGDEVAKGIVEGSRQVEIKVPLVIRLSGTNEAEGRAILKENGYEVAATMEEAAKKIVALTR
ncbi:ADP-forming succinate--CoA ligase subunit beta [bacterium]|nr:ADP-forming succinate--CoA ligase subunit beta [bacterium]